MNVALDAENCWPLLLTVTATEPLCSVVGAAHRSDVDDTNVAVEATESNRHCRVAELKMFVPNTVTSVAVPAGPSDGERPLTDSTAEHMLIQFVYKYQM